MMNVGKVASTLTYMNQPSVKAGARLQRVVICGNLPTSNAPSCICKLEHEMAIRRPAEAVLGRVAHLVGIE